MPVFCNLVSIIVINKNLNYLTFLQNLSHAALAETKNTTDKNTKDKNTTDKNVPDKNLTNKKPSKNKSGSAPSRGKKDKK